MKLKWHDLILMYNAIEKVSNSFDSMPFKTRFKFEFNKSKLEGIVKEFETFKAKCAESHAKVKEDGSLDFYSDEDKKEFFEEVEYILNIEREIELLKFTEEELESVLLPFDVFVAIEQLIEIEE